ncbi:blue copper protein 1a-like [Aristolochia californica]|uniref:blue copper protein 1a-like n=1 Tax=Aristolochia californica TaxID=171875 RepID=UPI0035DA6039
MASKQTFVFLITMASLPAISLAMVRDQTGWRTGFNNTVWTDGRYTRRTKTINEKGLAEKCKHGHSVLKADGDAFQSCTAPPDVTPLETGNDIITLEGSGT